MTDPASQLFVPRKRKVERKRGGGEVRDKHEFALVAATMLFMLLICLAPFLTYHPEVGEGGDSSIRQYGYITALLLSAYGAWPVFDSWRRYVPPLAVLMTLAWCWASVLWAVDPDNSLKRVFLTTDVILTTFWCVRALGGPRTLFLLRVTMALLLAANFLTVILAPDLGIHPPGDNKAYTVFGGMWRGIMAHKNFAGAACGVTIVLYAFDCANIAARYRIAVIALSSVFLYASQSKTSAGMAAIALAGGYILQKFSGRLRVFLILGLIVLMSVIYVLVQIFADSLGNDVLGPAAFTGRGQIWHALLSYSVDHPLLGAGFESFWNIGPQSPIYQYGLGFTTKVTVGHNGYLDLLVTIGFPGLLLAVLSLMILPMARVLISSKSVAKRSTLVGALLVFCIGHNFTESSLYERDALVGVFLLVSAALAQDFPVRSMGQSRSREDAQEVMRAVRRRRRRTTPV